ncbi:MAG TPA: DUF1015 domain-containing protein [Streptosporangiaceae bacterium]|nr:DUF1015 domain-containing protein [Streptosporangiaceae bacterium]
MQILPSGHDPAAPAQDGLALAPFRGLRYARERVSGLAEVTSPPYDVIAHDREDQLFAADPHNVVRLILPRHEPGHRGSAYDDAARDLREWRREQILVPDPGPSLYVYEQALAGGAVLQRGLIGAVRLSPPEAGVIRPHEYVAPGPVEGRLQLMQATQANLEPIFLLHDGSDRGASALLIDETAGGGPPLVDAETSDGIRHRLWAISDPADLAAIAADLAPRDALIADGHHRYAAYLKLQARRRAAGAGAGPWDYGLALLVDASAYPPDVGAIHRVIPALSPVAATELAKAAFTVRRPRGGLPDAVGELAAESERGPALLIAGGGDLRLLTEPDPVQMDAAMPEGHSPLWRSLGVSVLQELVLPRLWDVGWDAVRIVHNDAAEAVALADETGGTAVICPPVPTRDVYAIAAQGERVPRKSTSFGPKPRTGLVVRTFADG